MKILLRPGRAWPGIIGAVVVAASLAGAPPRKGRLAPDVAEILHRMTEAGKRLKTLSANLEYTVFTVLVNDKSTETGQIFFREGKDREIAIKIEKPDAKTIIFRKNKAEMFLPKINQIQEYDVGQQSGLVQQFFLLGFGKETEELRKAYTLKFLKEEDLEGDSTAVLELTPRKESLAEHIVKVQLWISEESWLPVQQQFFEPGGEYLISRYKGVKVNRRLPSSAFEISAQGAKRVKMN